MDSKSLKIDREEIGEQVEEKLTNALSVQVVKSQWKLAFERWNEESEEFQHLALAFERQYKNSND